MRFFLGLLLAASSYAGPTDEGLSRLMDGNQRFVQDKMIHCDKATERRDAVTSKQMPFAVVVGCSDSRVSPEIVFDQGIGDLFVVRIAGNVIGPTELDSIAYAVVQLKASLIMVLGHESCGAVTAVFDDKTKGIEAISKIIQPAIQGSASVDEAIKANVRQGIQTIKQYPQLTKLIGNDLKVVGGYYNLNTGKVDLIALN